MSKVVELTGRTEILAAIYSSNYLPSAVLSETKEGGPEPFCLHSLREGNLTDFENFLKCYKNVQNLKHNSETDEEVKAWLLPFFEEYHDVRHNCIGCYGGEHVHRIRDNLEACTKSTEDCA